MRALRVLRRRIVTVAKEFTAELVVKKSKFVATCSHAATLTAGREFVAKSSSPWATHNW
jgi:putative IMPACT (imprinted ancient) family translation regulator